MVPADAQRPGFEPQRAGRNGPPDAADAALDLPAGGAAKREHLADAAGMSHPQPHAATDDQQQPERSKRPPLPAHRRHEQQDAEDNRPDFQRGSDHDGHGAGRPPPAGPQRHGRRRRRHRPEIHPEIQQAQDGKADDQERRRRLLSPTLDEQDDDEPVGDEVEQQHAVHEARQIARHSDKSGEDGERAGRIFRGIVNVRAAGGGGELEVALKIADVTGRRGRTDQPDDKVRQQPGGEDCRQEPLAIRRRHRRAGASTDGQQRHSAADSRAQLWTRRIHAIVATVKNHGHRILRPLPRRAGA